MNESGEPYHSQGSNGDSQPIIKSNESKKSLAVFEFTDETDAVRKQIMTNSQRKIVKKPTVTKLLKKTLFGEQTSAPAAGSCNYCVSEKVITYK